MSDNIFNVQTKRNIKINGQRYKNLIKQGYIVENNKLLPPFIDSPIKKYLTENIALPIIMELDPPDLLALYLTNKNQFSYFNNFVNVLNSKYKIYATSFTDFMKKYNKTLITPNKLWLYELENNIEFPSSNYLSKLTHINKNALSILFDWMYSVCKSFKTINSFELSGSLVNLYTFKNPDIVNKTNLQLIGCVCMFLANHMLEEYLPDVSDYIYISDGVFSVKEFNDMTYIIYNNLQGYIIRPYISCFIEGTDEILKTFAHLASMYVLILHYKPSMIYEAIYYLLYGTYKIYTSNELSKICKLLVTLVNNSLKSKLDNFKNFAEIIKPNIKFECFIDTEKYEQLEFTNTNSWHIGNYEELELLGSGTYGVVKKIKRAECGKEYAVKTSDRNEEVIIEISILQLLKNNNNIITLCGYSVKLDEGLIYLPLAQGTVHSLIVEKKLDQNKFLYYWKQMLEGLKYMHHNDIIHRDIKSNNIVYDENEDRFKIIDFGSSVTYASTKKYLELSMANTITYRPPEIFLESTHYNYKIDIWSIGCVFYFMVTGYNLIQAPFEDDNILIQIFKYFGMPNETTWPGVTQLPYWKNIIEFINVNNIKMKDQINTSLLKKELTKYYDIIMPCFILNPNQRADTKKLIQLINSQTI